jgi:hypothetical protein
MVARSKCSNQRPDTLMQDRNRQLDENLRTAGPYIWVRFGRCRTALRWSAFPWCADVASRSSQSGTPGRCRRSSQAPPQSQRLPPWARCRAADLGGRYPRRDRVANRRGLSSSRAPRIRGWRRPRAERRSPSLQRPDRLVSRYNHQHRIAPAESLGPFSSRLLTQAEDSGAEWPYIFHAFHQEHRAAAAGCDGQCCQVSSSGVNGSLGSSIPSEMSSVVLQSGHGAPAAPQGQARGPCHGRSGWFSQTQPQSSQREHVVRTDPRQLE